MEYVPKEHLDCVLSEKHSAPVDDCAAGGEDVR